MLDISDVVTTKTTCAYCGVGCGVAVKQEKHSLSLLDVGGDVKHPANSGRLCIKGANLGRTLNSPERLINPVVDGEVVHYAEAVDAISERLQAVIDEHGPEAVGFYLSGQLLTEDYYVANKLAKGFIGTPHVDTNSRLCMSSAVVAHQRAFGEDLVPGCYEDLEAADLVLLVGSNMAWTHPIVFQRLLKARERNPLMQIVVLDPKQTATAQLADVHLPLVPATDGYFFTGLLSYLASEKAIDESFISAHTENFALALAAAQLATPDIASVASACDLQAADVTKVYAAFANTSKVVTVFSQGINQSNTGADKGSAIINCHLATGKIGRPGASPFSITGQPNAMGGREVGGLATQLAAHRGYDDPQQIQAVADFWQAPNIVKQPGYKAVDMFEAVADGRIKAIWIMGTNPVVSLPAADKVQQALQDCPLVIVSDAHGNTETTACADIIMPVSGWGERDGTVTNSDRTISRQRAFLASPGDCLQDWQVLSAVAQRMGYGAAFAYANSAAVFREHAQLSVHEDAGSAHRVFNLGPMATLSDEEYDHMQPVQWPVTNNQAAEAWQGTPRLFTEGRFATSSGRANFCPVTPQAAQGSSSEDYPLWLNSGRLRDQWHTMTRTGSVDQLMRHEPEPRIEMHPFDLQAFGLHEDQWAKVESDQGQYVARVRSTPALRQGQVFVPIHWSATFASAAKASSLVAPIVDSASGQPQFKQTPVRVEPLAMQWQARLVSSDNLTFDADSPWHWHKSPLGGNWQWKMAGVEQVDWQALLGSLLPTADDSMVLKSSHGHSLRLALYQQGKLLAVLWVADYLPSFNEALVQKMLSLPRCDAKQRLLVLAGQQGQAAQVDKMICSCMQVTASAIDKAIVGGATSTAQLKQQLGCGSGCGSCLGEVQERLSLAKQVA